MNDEQLLRYSRHLLLDDIGIAGQEHWLAAHALMIGAGGLGSAVAMYLTSSGIGRLTIVDDDRVELTNLQRQIAHRTDAVGMPKVASMAGTLRGLNAAVDVRTVHARADTASLAEWIVDADVAIDCSDNFITRQALNAACVATGTPLVSGAAIGFDGQVSVFDTRDAASPCYACVYPPETAPLEARCATLGVFAPLVGIIGSVQAAEALKLLAGIGPTLAGRLLLLDARRMEWTELSTPRQTGCPVCAVRASSTRRLP